MRVFQRTVSADVQSRVSRGEISPRPHGRSDISLRVHGRNYISRIRGSGTSSFGQLFSQQWSILADAAEESAAEIAQTVEAEEEKPGRLRALETAQRWLASVIIQREAKRGQVRQRGPKARGV